MAECKTINCPICGCTISETFVEQKCPRCQALIESKFICGNCHNCSETSIDSEVTNTAKKNIFDKLISKVFRKN